MRLQNITATPHPSGNRIDLKWVNPDPTQFPGVRVMRREGTHPVTPQDGLLVAEGLGLNSVSDTPLQGETVYYYTLFPFTGAPPVYAVDLYNRASAMATAPYNLAGQMYDLLPAIYRRYDTVLPRPPFPIDMLEEDKQKAQLRRFLDLPGNQLDQLYSLTRAILDSYNLDRVDGRLLPLLAQWIGWKTDYSLEIETQRNEIRNAPAIYETIGLIPTVEATVKRISGWGSRTKEFVHNVFLSNRPERLNLWARQRSAVTGAWSVPTCPLSLNFAYEGRPTVARASDGALWLFYHTLKKHRWDIWYKISRDQGQTWESSQPLTSRLGVDKHPTAAAQGATLWLFWGAYDETSRKWRIHFRTCTAGTWSAIETFIDATTERRLPVATVDGTGGLWLFWLERVGAQWQLKYNRHDGTNWQLSAAADFPLDSGSHPGVEGDVYVLFHPTSANMRLWVFWAGQESIAPGQTRYTIAYRVKPSLDPAASDWGAASTLSKAAPGNYHDRDPAALVDGSGNIQLFWSSNQAGPWLILCNTLSIGTLAWGTAEWVSPGPYSQRTPLPLTIATGTLLIYRSNESLAYTSAVYSTKTIDLRYAGSTTVHVRNAAKLALRSKLEDFLAYTYDAGQNGTRTNDDRIARDTIGLYLTPDTADADKIKAGLARIAAVIEEFMPIADRAVFVTGQSAIP